MNLNGTPGETNDFVSFTLFADRTGPRVTQHSPSGGVPLGLGAMEIEFNEAIDPATFNPADAFILTPTGETNTVTAVQTLSSNRFRVTFPPLATPGLHRLRVGPNVQDLAGNSLDQDRDGNAGEGPDDVYDACFYAHEIVSPLGLVARWPADGNANDLVGTNNGMLKNGASYAPGLVGMAFSFSATNPLTGPSNSVVVVSDSPALHFGTDDITVEAWIKMPPLWPGANLPTFIGKVARSSPYGGIVFDIDNLSGKLEFAVTVCGTVSCGWRTESKQPVVSASRIDDDRWHHVADVRISTGYRLYVDG